MKISIQLANSASTASPGVNNSQASGTDFRDTFVAAIAARGDHSEKSATTQESKKKSAPAQTAKAEPTVQQGTTSTTTVVPDQKPATFASLPQMTLGLPVIDPSQLASTSQPSDTTAANGFTAISTAPGALSFSPRPVSPVAVVSDSPVANAGTISLSSVSSHAPIEGQGAVDSAMGGIAPQSKSSDIKTQGQQTQDLKTQDLKTQDPKTQNLATSDSKGTTAKNVTPPAADSASARDAAASAASTSVSGVGSNASSTAALQATPTEQPNIVASMPFPLASLQGDPRMNSSLTAGKAATSNLAEKDSTARDAGAAGKGHALSSDSKDKRSVDSDENGQASDAVVSAPIAGRAADSQTGSNQNTSAGKGSPDAAAIQQMTQVAQPSSSTHGQAAPQDMAAAPAAAAQVQAQTPAPAANSPDGNTMPSVNSAQLIQSMQHSEMRLGMQSAEFGNISISTSLNHQALSAQISLDHSELGRALAVHLPAIEEKLGTAYGVQARVEVRDGGSQSSYSNSGQQSKENRQAQSGARMATGSPVLGRMSAVTSSTTTPVAASTSRLDIRI